jgi:synaptic vesicle membrane protein VAT-1
MSPTPIRKVLISAFGDVSNVNVVQSTIDDPAPDHVRVRVVYSGFAGSDINMRLGHYPMQKKAPLTPGYCLVGTVEKNGSSSSKFQPGTLVSALTIYDAEAELCNVPEKYLVPVPSGLDLQKACALILDWNTAYGMVMHTGKVHKGQRVFVHGISGAVGYATAALCQLQGAEVYGTASPRNHEVIRSYGWTVFDYRNKDWMDTMKSLGGADVVFDPLGFESWDESYSVLSSNHGLLIGYGGNLATLNNGEARGILFPTIKLLSRNLMCPVVHKNTRFYYITRDDKTFVPDLEALYGLLADGRIDVRIKAVYEMDRVKEAHESWGKSQTVGSVVMRIAEEH